MQNIWADLQKPHGSLSLQKSFDREASRDSQIRTYPVLLSTHLLLVRYLKLITGYYMLVIRSGQFIKSTQGPAYLGIASAVILLSYAGDGFASFYSMDYNLITN